jgi:hypothetical protein
METFVPVPVLLLAAPVIAILEESVFSWTPALMELMMHQETSSTSTILIPKLLLTSTPWMFTVENAPQPGLSWLQTTRIVSAAQAGLMDGMFTIALAGWCWIPKLAMTGTLLTNGRKIPQGFVVVATLGPRPARRRDSVNSRNLLSHLPGCTKSTLGSGKRFTKVTVET